MSDTPTSNTQNPNDTVIPSRPGPKTLIGAIVIIAGLLAIFYF